MREEIDAMRVLGLDPIELLVLPRVLALVLMLPLLGPSTVRDAAALPLDITGDIWRYKEPAYIRNTGTALRVVDQRAGLLKAFGRDKAAEKEPLRFITMQCNRTLTPGAKVQIVYGKGVATPSGVPNNVERRLEFQVREPFAASFTCERENAQAACLPLRPMQLNFNAPVTRKLAAQIELKGGDKT
eukprot:gene12224-16471_t